MARNQVIIKFPTLNDKGGDLSKKWYVEYYYRLPNSPVVHKRRISKGLCTGSDEGRRSNAARIIETVTAKLKHPDFFTARPNDISKVLYDDTFLRPEADRYAEQEALTSNEGLTQSFMEYLHSSIAVKTYQTYKSKLKYYTEWLNKQHKHCLYITQVEVLPFFRWLADERKLTKRSIFKYKQILNSFYKWLIKNGYIDENPIDDIPNYGTIVDCAPVPINKSDRERLREAIERADPYLWLACELQYYCAIRPGQELRLLQVRDIHIEDMSITIRQDNAKNRHKETVPITQQIADMIIRLGVMNYAPDMYVFGTYNVPAPEPTGKNTLRNRFNKYRDDLGIDKRVKFYSWKHTGAISMVNNGASTWQLQHHMRHNSITTTEEYIRQRASQSRQAQEFIDDL